MHGIDVTDSALLREAIPGLKLLEGLEQTNLRTELINGPLVQVTGSAPYGAPGLRLEVDLQDAVAYWHPGLRGTRALPADWSGEDITSLVRSAPIGVIHNAAGTALLGWAAGDGVAEFSTLAGVSEERKTFIVEIRPVRRQSELVVIFDGARSSLVDTVRRLSQWLSTKCAGKVLEPPAVSKLPVYSTWYTFTQDVNADEVVQEAALAAEIGFGSIFIDDGWQRFAVGRGYQGCGDWSPDKEKFPDLTDTVQALHSKGLAVALWVAPLLLGRDSEISPTLEEHAPAWVPELNCHVLDPRIHAVREHVANLCLRLVRDFRVDILKVDFLDQAMVYRNNDEQSESPDIGLAMAQMLAQVRHRLAAEGFSGVAFEFRQPYVSPALARSAEILRANDCPADSVVNRTGIVDSRMIAVGQVVHSDPMMWGPGGGAEAVAQQIYSAWPAVPQVSMRLRDLSTDQAAALRGLLELWRSQAEVVLDGELQVVGAERGYDLLRAVHRELGREVCIRYAAMVVDVGNHSGVTETTILNATTDRRVVLRLTTGSDSGVIRSASAQIIGSISPKGPGLVELEVPAFGSLTISFSPNRLADDSP